MNKKIIIPVLVILLLTFVCGCTTNESAGTNNKTIQPTIDYKIVVCPNPDCPLHDPNYQINAYGVGGRPIEMSYGLSSGNSITYYLCQICGAKWSE